MIKVDNGDMSNPLYNQKGVDNYILYLHKSPSNKYYVGITCQGIERRWRYDGSGYYQCKYFYNAIQKYGFNNFEHFIVRLGLDEDTANECEINMIKNLREAGFQLYNVSNGGRAVFKGLHLSEEHKKKISESNIGRPPTKMTDVGKQRLINSLKGNKNALGYHHTQETKERISRTLTGRSRKPFTQEQLKHMSECRKGKPLSDAQKEQLKRLHEQMRGRKMSQEEIQKLIERNKKPVIQYDLNMNKISEYPSIKEAAACVDGRASCISACCTGRSHTSKGYIWRLKEDFNDVRN